MANNEEELRKIITVAKIMDEKLSPSEKRKLMSLIEDFVDKRRISHTNSANLFTFCWPEKFKKMKIERPNKTIVFLASQRFIKPSRIILRLGLT
ncbi:unnamed protein product [Microthlaspi erraticum]|uniref:Uncharacterized protein n=1 Tax=Microthlaspi erraticum TaxID=1685480 RepID=A0A6D2K0Y0_9BRAS|nr:unnamed protein product [Microthlaspi erraticum]